MTIFSRLHLIIYTLFLSFALSTGLNAQRLISTKYTIDHGLSSNRIYSIVQDSLGFVWFGTNYGLNRFDGTSFKQYFYGETAGSISSNSIRKLLIDKRQQMWIALDNGVDIYDPHTDTFRHLDAVTADGEAVSYRVLDMLEDSEGDIWIATNGMGVYVYTPATGGLRVYCHTPGDEYSLAQNTVVTLHQDSRGNIWMGTYSEGLCCYSKAHDRFVNHKKSDTAGSISDNSIQSIFEDSYGNLWIGTFQNGLDLYNYTTNSFTNFQDHSRDNLLYHIQDIIEYTPGELLIASDNGISVFNISQGRILADEESDLRINSNSTKFVYSLYIDKEESLWLGSYFDGIEFYSGFQNNFGFYGCNDTDNGKSGKVINSICEDADGNYWIGTDDNGIHHFDARTRQTTPFRTANDIGSTYYCIHELLLDDGKLYAATYERGLEVFDLRTGVVKQYLHHAADTTTLSSSRVFDLYKASNGNIYVGTSVGLCLYNRDTDDFRRVASFGKVESIIEDAQGRVWVSTSENGLYSFDLKMKTTSDYKFSEADPYSISRNTLTVLALDNKKRLWVGTHGYGLCRYDESTNRFVRYYLPGFPNQIISSILPEGDYLWISTNKGLVYYNPDSGEMKTYSKSNGLYNEQFTPGAGIRSSDGKILLGSADGFCYFSPRQISENQFNSPVVLTDMTILGESVKAGAPGSPLSQSIEYTREVVLTHKQSFLGFRFASLSYISPEENQYQYILEGFDPDWRTAKGNYSNIQYTNLPVGDYMLRVKGTNSDSLWSTNQIALKIKILPPFFKSKLAYFIYASAIFISLILLMAYYIKHTERKQRRRIEEINQQKEKELYDSKIEFFTHIAHEIRTPLSLIMGPLEYLRGSATLEAEYKDYLGIIEQNHNRLSALVNQLLDFRKVDAGLYKLSYNTYNLLSLLEKIMAPFELTTRQKNIRMDISVDPQELPVITDEEAFTKIISNLLTNAIKYARGHICISARSTDHASLLIEVTDDGIGIQAEEREKIFNAFYQVKENKEVNKLGIGIGLNMTRSIISLMGGQITACDREDGHSGLTISVLLPQNKENLKKDGQEKKIETVFVLDDDNNELSETLAESNVEHKSGAVLVVDDNQDILDFLSKVLHRDYFVISASSGGEAMIILENNQVDLIVSDVMMDEMDGFELCRRVKSNISTSHIPVVLLTAKTDTASKIRGLESGADAYIEKPFSPFHLNAQIRNLLEKREEVRKQFATSPFAELRSTVHNKLDEEFMDKCTVIIHSSISDPDFTVNTLARELGMSRTAVFVKVKGITGMTPNDFIKLTRLKAACKMMAEGEYRITEVGFLVGFSSSSYFAKCFQKQFGMLPNEFVKGLKE